MSSEVSDIHKTQKGMKSTFGASVDASFNGFQGNVQSMKQIFREEGACALQLTSPSIVIQLAEMSVLWYFPWRVDGQLKKRRRVELT